VSALGSPRVHLRLTDSTNDRARELAIAGAPHGTLVTASEQTAGRGRQGRRWTAPAGSALLMSLILRSPPPLLPLIAAVAVCEAAGDRAQIKWPNDIVLLGAEPKRAGAPPRGAAEGVSADAAGPPLRKLAGILAEGRPQQGWAVLGIGLNVAVRLAELPPELRGGAPGAGAPMAAASLGEDPRELEPALARVLGAMQRRLAEPPEATLRAWRERDALLGREIGWAGGRGRAQGIDGEGRLIVALTGGGMTTLGAGEVHLESIA
jgi:BirA family biotin operon repressor/biotin-[acetyl-CoA-carboxylase] ligase